MISYLLGFAHKPVVLFQRLEDIFPDQMWIQPWWSQEAYLSSKLFFPIFWNVLNYRISIYFSLEKVKRLWI